MTAASFFRIRLIRLYPLYLLGTLLGVPVALMALRYGGNGLSVDWSLRLFMANLPFSILMLPIRWLSWVVNGVGPCVVMSGAGRL